jgi:hypothetical protein
VKHFRRNKWIQNKKRRRKEEEGKKRRGFERKARN